MQGRIHIYELSLKDNDGTSPLLDIAENLLFMPDLFNYFFTGIKVNEATDASHEALANWSTSIYSRQSVVSGRNTRSVLLHLANLGSAAPHLRQCVGDGAA